MVWGCGSWHTRPELVLQASRVHLPGEAVERAWSPPLTRAAKGQTFGEQEARDLVVQENQAPGSCLASRGQERGGWM